LVKHNIRHIIKLGEISDEDKHRILDILYKKEGGKAENAFLAFLVFCQMKNIPCNGKSFKQANFKKDKDKSDVYNPYDDCPLDSGSLSIAFKYGYSKKYIVKKSKNRRRLDVDLIRKNPLFKEQCEGWGRYR
jgi:hypothetical protein